MPNKFGKLWAAKHDESLSKSATSKRQKTAGGTGYEYVIPASALSVNSVDMDKECGLSVKSVRLDEEEDFPATNSIHPFGFEYGCRCPRESDP